MFKNPIKGDPLTEGKPYHLSLDWYDVVLVDQLSPFTRNSEINEHINESKGWVEFLEQITDAERGIDLSMRWWEYRGKACNDGRKAPLVVCLYTFYNTSWQYIADREGLVLLAFEDHRNQRRPDGGLGALGFGPKDDEIEGYDIVIERVLEKYDCDRSRVYLNGQSYGDFSSLVYTSKYGHKLAALASINGPTSPYNLREYGIEDRLQPLPCMQIRSDDDFTCDGFTAGYAFKLEGNEEWIRNIRSRIVTMNRNIWLRVNEADVQRPLIYTEDDRAYVCYKGRHAEVIYVELNKKGHNIPIDNAEMIWEHLFSRYRRSAENEIEQIRQFREPDNGAIALVAGEAAGYINNNVVKLSAASVVLDPYDDIPAISKICCERECSYSSLYSPADILSEGFGISYTYEENDVTLSGFTVGRGNDAIKLEDGVISFSYRNNEYKLFTNCCVASVNGRIRNLERPPLTISGSLMIPVCEVAKLLGLFSSARNDVVYISNHAFGMGYTLTRYLREEILPDKPYVLSCNVSVYPSQNGSCTVSKDTLKEGETLVVKTNPDNGFLTGSVRASLNGVEILLNKVGENEYWLCNAAGDIEIAAEFAPA